MNRKILAVAATLTVALSSAPQASITVYTSQTAFLAALSASGTDTFNNLSITSTTASPLNRSAGSYTYTATAANATSGASSFYGAGSGSDHWLSTNISGDVITFSNFSSGVSAFGGLFFASNAAGLYTAGGVTLTATDASGTITQVLATPTTSTFLGFISTGLITQTTLASNITTTAIWPTANNLVLGTAAAPNAGVPEPASWAMMISGFGLVGGALRRRAVHAAIA